MAVSRLTPAQIRALDATLRSAFPDHRSLARLVRMWLGESLDEIVPLGSLKDDCYNLISWAESQDRVGELIRGALAETPTNARLRTLATELGVALPSATDTAPAPTNRPLILQALLGSKSCTVSIMLGLALLVIAGASSGAVAGWIGSLLPFPATATPILIHVPTAAPSATPLDATTTATATPSPQIVVTAQPATAPAAATPNVTATALSATAAEATLTAVAANRLQTAIATTNPAGRTPPPATPSPSPTATAAALPTASLTPTRLPLTPPTAGPPAGATPTHSPTGTATAILPPPVPPFTTAAATASVPSKATPSLTGPPTASPSPTLLPAGTPCPWTLPVSGYTGGVYARPAVGRRLGCSTVNYEAGVPAAAIQAFQQGYLFRDSTTHQVFVLVRQAPGATQGSWRVYPDPLPASDADPGASLRQSLADQPTVDSDLGTALETPQARLQSGSQFHAAAQPFANGYLLWSDQPYPVFALYSDSRHWDAYNLP